MVFVHEVMLKHTCNPMPIECQVTGNRIKIERGVNKLKDIKWKLRQEGVEYGKTFYGLYFCPFCGRDLPSEKTIKTEL